MYFILTFKPLTPLAGSQGEAAADQSAGLGAAPDALPEAGAVAGRHPARGPTGKVGRVLGGTAGLCRYRGRWLSIYWSIHVFVVW